MAKQSDKNLEKFGEYYIGLDVGSGSCGWAVTDEDYNIVKIAGKHLWGSRLFAPGNTAEDRRVFRANRRRLQRRAWRISLLNELFNTELAKKDPSFLIRLKESELNGDDPNKTIKNRFFLFDDQNFTDKDYLKNYPTIYHLRNKLLTDGVDDIRLLYLGIHHIIKHRGHFLYQLGTNELLDKIKNATFAWDNACESVASCLLKDTEESPAKEDLKLALIDLLKANDFEALVAKGITEKKQNIDDAFKSLATFEKENSADLPPDYKSLKKETMNLIKGNVADCTKLFGIEDLDEPIKIKFYADDFDANFDKLSDEQQGHVENIKAFYDLVKVKDLLGENSYLSQAKVKLYNEHQQDLKIFKSLIKEKLTQERLTAAGYKGTLQEFKKDIFLDEKDVDKSVKIARNNPDDKACNGSFYYNLTHGQRASYLEPSDKFKKGKAYSDYKVLTTLAKNWLSDEASGLSKEEKLLLSMLDNLTLLPTCTTKENCLLPYQLNEIELNKILEIAENKFTFLKVKGNDGLSVSDKIKSLLTFRIPYFVGPLNEHSKFAWIKRKEDGSITPWNFENKVDLSGSAEKFIKRMTCKCTYLFEKDVLPKNSPIYCKFMALDILNNLHLKGRRLNTLQHGLVKEIFYDVCCKRKITKLNHIKKYLTDRSLLTDSDLLEGMDEDQSINMSSWIDFTNLLSTLKIDNLTPISDFCEKVVFYSTVFGANQKLLKERLKEEFKDLSNKYPALIDKACKLKYSGWGSLSKELLVDIKGMSKLQPTDPDNILNYMEQGFGNLMELLSKNFTFSDAIKNINRKSRNSVNIFSYENLVKDLYCSPSVKKMIWQTLLVVKEITEDIMGYPPKRIFVETTRGNLESKKGQKTQSRYDFLNEIYKDILNNKDKCAICKEHDIDIKALSNELVSVSNASLSKNNNKLYYYYLQLGKCMYSGEDINLNDLSDDSLVDIEHIYPRAKGGQDDFSNKVLVKKIKNASKSDNSLSSAVVQKMKPFWQHLQKLGLLSNINDKYGTKKLATLCKAGNLSEMEQEGFIARQLVDTSQATKELVHLLEDLYGPNNTKVVSNKANMIFKFKSYYGLRKVRELNNLHHAKDAYCNIVAGNIYYTTFNSFNFSRVDEVFSTVSLDPTDKEKPYIFNYYLSKDKKEQIRKIYYRNDILLTEKTEETTGTFYDQTLYAKKAELESKKKNLPSELYGGYKSLKGAFDCLVKVTTKKTEYVKLISIPILYKNKVKEYLDKTLSCEKQFVSYQVLIEKIKGPYLLSNDSKGCIYRISGHSNGYLLSGQYHSLVLNENLTKTLSKIYQYSNKKKEDNNAQVNCFDAEINSLFKSIGERTLCAPLCNLDIQYQKIFDIFRSLPIEKLKLTLELKADLIVELIKIFQNKTVTVNTKLLSDYCDKASVSSDDICVLKEFIEFYQKEKKSKLSKYAGKCNISENLPIKDNWSIINRSVTGFYESAVSINELFKRK